MDRIGSALREPYRVMAFANLVRFDGPGFWPGRIRIGKWVEVDEVEIVRTDRHLSRGGTTTRWSLLQSGNEGMNA